MNRLYKKIQILIGVGACICALPAMAQEILKSGYFLQSNLYNHQVNPAFEPKVNGYVAIPVIGQLNIGVNANVGVSNFLFPQSNQCLSTFMSESVNADAFLNKLPQDVNVLFGARVGLVSVGFTAFNGFNTVDVGIRGNGYIKIGSELFRVMKNGFTREDGVYDLGSTEFFGQGVAELALGHSHRLNKKLQVGAKLKLLFGLGLVTAHLKNMRVKMNDEQWEVSGEGEVLSSFAKQAMFTNQEARSQYGAGEENWLNWDKSFSFEESPIGMSGFGAAVDLGAVYQITEDLDISGAITDLGVMSWSHNERAYTDKSTWTFNGFENIPYKSEDAAGNERPNSLDNQFEEIKNQLEDFYKLKKDLHPGSLSKALIAQVTVGAKYRLPTYHALSFGFVGNTRLFGDLSWMEGRAYVNLEPVRWFSCSVNGGMTSVGPAMGWMLSFHPGVVNLFVGSDYQRLQVTPKYYLPVNKGGANYAMGLNITW